MIAPVNILCVSELAFAGDVAAEDLAAFLGQWAQGAVPDTVPHARGLKVSGVQVTKPVTLADGRPGFKVVVRHEPNPASPVVALCQLRPPEVPPDLAAAGFVALADHARFRTRLAPPDAGQGG